MDNCLKPRRSFIQPTGVDCRSLNGSGNAMGSIVAGPRGISHSPAMETRGGIVIMWNTASGSSPRGFSETVYNKAFGKVAVWTLRASAKELLRHRFIRNARKSPKLLDRIRDRPKYQVKDDDDSPRSSLGEFEDGSGTVKVTRSLRDERTVSASPAKSLRNDGWDFTMTASLGTGTVRRFEKPPQVAGIREKNVEANSHASPRNALDKRNSWSSTRGTVLQESSMEVSHNKDSRYQNDNEVEDDNLDDEQLSVSGSGTVVVRSPKGIKASSSSFFSDQSTMSNNRYAATEDVSSSGTVVLRSQLDESDTPRTPKSRLGIQEKSSTASREDSEANLAAAKAALQAGFRKGNARERSGMSKPKKDGQEKSAERTRGSPTSSRSSREYFDAQKASPLLRQASEHEDLATLAAASASPALSKLLIPSLKEAVGDESEGSVARIVADSLLHLERMKPGSCEDIVSGMLKRLGSSNEASLVGLKELATSTFTSNPKAPAETDNASMEAPDQRRQHNAEISENPNLSPLAKFLLTRWQGNVAQDLNPI